jgi:hypothetical protein
MKGCGVWGCVAGGGREVRERCKTKGEDHVGVKATVWRLMPSGSQQRNMHSPMPLHCWVSIKLCVCDPPPSNSQYESVDITRVEHALYCCMCI